MQGRGAVHRFVSGGSLAGSLRKGRDEEEKRDMRVVPIAH